MKQDRADAHENATNWFALMPCQPPQGHTFLHSAMDLLWLEQAITSKISKKNGEGGKAGTLKGQQGEYCMLSPGIYLTAFNIGRKAK